MIVFAAASVLLLPKGVTPSPIGWSLAGLLVAGGIALIVDPRRLRNVAVGISVLVAATGVAALAGHPEASLPTQPWLTIIVSLYLCFRVFMAQVYAKSAEQPSVNDPE